MQIISLKKTPEIQRKQVIICIQLETVKLNEIEYISHVVRKCLQHLNLIFNHFYVKYCNIDYIHSVV